MLTTTTFKTQISQIRLRARTHGFLILSEGIECLFNALATYLWL